MESSIVEHVHDAFLASLEEQGEVDLAEALRPLLEGGSLPRPAELADLIARLAGAGS
jgi:hypothetical protein